jgi:hypothetical protein
MTRLVAAFSDLPFTRGHGCAVPADIRQHLSRGIPRMCLSWLAPGSRRKYAQPKRSSHRVESEGEVTALAARDLERASQFAARHKISRAPARTRSYSRTRKTLDQGHPGDTRASQLPAGRGSEIRCCPVRASSARSVLAVGRPSRIRRSPKAAALTAWADVVRSWQDLKHARDSCPTIHRHAGRTRHGCPPLVLPEAGLA